MIDRFRDLKTQWRWKNMDQSEKIHAIEKNFQPVFEDFNVREHDISLNAGMSEATIFVTVDLGFCGLKDHRASFTIDPIVATNSARQNELYKAINNMLTSCRSLHTIDKHNIQCCPQYDVETETRYTHIECRRCGIKEDIPEAPWAEKLQHWFFGALLEYECY